jgi:hypothetical protein
MCSLSKVKINKNNHLQEKVTLLFTLLLEVSERMLGVVSNQLSRNGSAGATLLKPRSEDHEQVSEAD